VLHWERQLLLLGLVLLLTPISVAILRSPRSRTRGVGLGPSRLRHRFRRLQLLCLSLLGLSALAWIITHVSTQIYHDHGGFDGDLARPPEPTVEPHAVQAVVVATFMLTCAYAAELWAAMVVGGDSASDPRH
jgi:hypothetical protein